MHITILKRSQDSSFNPGGWLDPPSPYHPANTSRLALHVYPKYNFYLTTEETGIFIVDTPVSAQGGFGSVFKNRTFDPDHSHSESIPLTELRLTVYNGRRKLVDHARVPVNVSGFEVSFNISDVSSAEGQYGKGQFYAMANSPDGIQTFQSQTTVQVLHPRNDSGSMARLDRLTGGIQVRSSLTNNSWKAIFPMSFYTRWDWVSWVVDPEHNPIPPNLASNQTKNLAEFRKRGYNLIHPVPPGGWASFDNELFEKFLTECDKLELYVMYDMRHTYLNLSSISYQLPRLQKHPSLLLYYTGDEPDGWTDPLNGTKLAYDRIRSIDPYHPVSLVLNCYNFYFREYTSGADIILEDAYNLIKSSTFSTVYNTPCNRTYGDCGCDFCHKDDPAYPEYVENPWLDIVDRTDKMYAYQQWTNSLFQKPVWGVPQWFYDADSFWERWATGQEALVMALLRINHGAMGVVAWLYPTSTEIENSTTELAKVLEREDITELLVAAKRQRVVSPAEPLLDASIWVGDTEVLISIVWQANRAGNSSLLELPVRIDSVETLLGAEGWSVGQNRTLRKEEKLPFEVSVLKARIVDH